MMNQDNIGNEVCSTEQIARRLRTFLKFFQASLGIRDLDLNQSPAYSEITLTMIDGTRLIVTVGPRVDL